MKYLYLRFELLYLGLNTFLCPRLVRRTIETMWKMCLVISNCTVNLLLFKAPYITEISVGQDCAVQACAVQACALQLSIGEVSKSYGFCTH